MSTLARPAVRGQLAIAISDGITLTWRNLINYLREPQATFFATVQPIMFVLLFRYVFGGAINVPGVSYVDYLMPGIFVQTLGFGAAATAIGLAEDLHTGLIERFRSLPMARSAVLAGRTAADLVRNVFVFSLMTAVGLLVGFRFHNGLLPFLAGGLVVLTYSFAMSWVFAFIGMSASSGEAAQLMTFPVLFPLGFASSAFVPVDSMPGWLQVFARHQPVTAAIDAIRVLVLGGPATGKVLTSLAWSAGLLLVFAPLAVRRYRRVA